MFPEISLDDVAREAGVSVQTVLRHYGSRAALIECHIEYAIARVARSGSRPGATSTRRSRVIVDHYELRGDTVDAHARPGGTATSRSAGSPRSGRVCTATGWSSVLRAVRRGRRRTSSTCCRRHRRLHLEAAAPRPRATREPRPRTQMKKLVRAVLDQRRRRDTVMSRAPVRHLGRRRQRPAGPRHRRRAQGTWPPRSGSSATRATATRSPARGSSSRPSAGASRSRAARSTRRTHGRIFSDAGIGARRGGARAAAPRPTSWSSTA